MKKHLFASKEVITLQILRIFSSFLFFFLIQVNTFSQERIIGGAPIDISARPFQVSIEDKYFDYIHRCGGVILNEEWVLTAGHCFNINVPDPSRYTVHAGATDQTDNSIGQRIEVAEIVFHPDWLLAAGHIEFGPDLALIRLKTPLCFNANIQPIAYAASNQDLPIGTMVALSGWGAISDGGASVAELRGVDLPIISDENANTLFASPNNTCTNPPPVNEDYIAFFDVAGKSTAQGDSGGPATINNGTLLIGVHSWGGCPREEFPSVYTDIRPFTDFIEDHINQPGGTDEYINENTLIDTDQDFHGNLIVQEGFELKITATVRFTEGHGINVERGAKLHLDGGTLTRHCSAPDWKGINVEGNSGLTQPSSPITMPAANQAGVVLLTKNSQEVPATIEWARNAISTTKFGQSWNSAYWGGLVHCENSQFLNCRRAAEFMKYDFTNKSEFKNCTISNGGTGVTIWDTDGIDFDNCTFKNLGTSGVLVWDAGANIKNGCTFAGNRYGVQSNATSTVSSGSFLRIEKFGGAPNVFDDNDYMDVELRAGGLSKNVRILDNLFKNTLSYGIWLDGRNSANVRRNAFINEDWAIAGQNIGLGNTTFYCNDLSQNVELGIYLENDNQRTKFLKNRFETNWLDFVLYGDEAAGSVHPDQRNTSTTPAGNCFSAIHHEHIVTLAPTVSFNYHVLSSDPPPCQLPLPSSFGTNNYSTSFTSSPPSIEDCGLDLDVGPEAEGPYVYNDYHTVRQEYLALKVQLDADPGNVQLLGETLRKEEQKEGIVAWFIRDAINSGSMATAQTVLNEEGTTESQRLLYGMKVQLNDYTGAQSTLSSLPNGTQDEQWFRAVQEINLERLQSEGQFSLSNEQDSLLYVVANSKSPERSYARAILSLLKDEQFLPDIDLQLGEQRQNSSHPPIENQQGNIISENKVSIIPNPSMGEFEVVLDSGSAKGGTITVLSSTGKILSEYPLPESNRQTLHLTDLPNGIYLLQISSNNRIVGRSKLVISN